LAFLALGGNDNVEEGQNSIWMWGAVFIFIASGWCARLSTWFF